MSVAGQVASDGSFTLANSSTGTTVQVKIAGKVPGKGETNWPGKLSVTMTNCPSPWVQDFVATPLPPLNGTYAGTLSGPKIGSTVQVSMQVAQGGIDIEQNVLATVPLSFYFPLTSTISVSGSPCFKTGTAIPGMGSAVTGDSIIVNYRMDDNSTVMLGGFYGDANGSTLGFLTSRVIGGNCAGGFGGGTLTKQ